MRNAAVAVVITPVVALHLVSPVNASNERWRTLVWVIVSTRLQHPQQLTKLLRRRIRSALCQER
jgi:hypothetical protein